MRIITGLCGVKRSGKNSFANMLQKLAEADGFRVVQIAFADELRQHLEILNPVVGWNEGNENEVMWRWVEAVKFFGYDGAKDRFPEIRRLLQRYGTDVMRERVDESFWVKAVCMRVRAALILHGANVLLLLTDMRFANEHHGVAVLAGKSLLNAHFDLVCIQRPSEVPTDPHASEDLSWTQEIEDRIVVLNDGLLSDLELNAHLYWEKAKTSV